MYIYVFFFLLRQFWYSIEFMILMCLKNLHPMNRDTVERPRLNLITKLGHLKVMLHQYFLISIHIIADTILYDTGSVYFPQHFTHIQLHFSGHINQLISCYSDFSLQTRLKIVSWKTNPPLNQEQIVVLDTAAPCESQQFCFPGYFDPKSPCNSKTSREMVLV